MNPDTYAKKIARLHAELGIPLNYAQERNLVLQREPDALVSIETDIFSRPQQLTIEAANNWAKMRDAAKKENVLLSVVSAFRSVDYQTQLFNKKLAAGHTIETILTVNAAPGYSEHHTGRCLDLTTSDCAPLEESFETTPAFLWLTKNAGDFGFNLSYPRNNPHHFVYEPWHWIFTAN